jgi:hypothetical protein
MTLGSTQPLTEMSTRNLSVCTEWQASRAANLTAICEPIIWKMWEPRLLTIVWASTELLQGYFLPFFFFFLEIELWKMDARKKIIV